MTKVALILLICSYSLATIGFSLKEFYCCGKLKSTTFSLIQNEQKKCSKGEGAGCCDNKYQFFKVKDTHISAEKIVNPANHFTDIQTYTPSFSISILAVQTSTVANCTHAPPLLARVPLYISNCVFKV